LPRVFFTTRKRAFWPRLLRSSPSWATVSPRYSVSTAPCELWNSSLSSVTAAALSGLAMGLLPTVNAGEVQESHGQGGGEKKKPRRGRTGDRKSTRLNS